MGKLKFVIAISLCAVLLAMPLAGMADNPLPTTNNADGHPWDDHSGNSQTPNNPGDTTRAVNIPAAKVFILGWSGNRLFLSTLRFGLTGKWRHLLF